MPIEFLHGRPLSQEDLDRIRLEIESLDSISVISPEMRGMSSAIGHTCCQSYRHRKQMGSGSVPVGQARSGS